MKRYCWTVCLATVALSLGILVALGAIGAINCGILTVCGAQDIRFALVAASIAAIFGAIGFVGMKVFADTSRKGRHPEG